MMKRLKTVLIYIAVSVFYFCTPGNQEEYIDINKFNSLLHIDLDINPDKITYLEHPKYEGVEEGHLYFIKIEGKYEILNKLSEKFKKNNVYNQSMEERATQYLYMYMINNSTDTIYTWWTPCMDKVNYCSFNRELGVNKHTQEFGLVAHVLCEDAIYMVLIE
tara:strand:+ start:28087 stop:28572 length:486 start_codon:yes stop_codon:yes gene_type:complete